MLSPTEIEVLKRSMSQMNQNLNGTIEDATLAALVIEHEKVRVLSEINGNLQTIARHIEDLAYMERNKR